MFRHGERVPRAIWSRAVKPSITTAMRVLRRWSDTRVRHPFDSDDTCSQLEALAYASARKLLLERLLTFGTPADYAEDMARDSVGYTCLVLCRDTDGLTQANATLLRFIDRCQEAGTWTNEERALGRIGSVAEGTRDGLLATFIRCIAKQCTRNVSRIVDNADPLLAKECRRVGKTRERMATLDDIVERADSSAEVSREQSLCSVSVAQFLDTLVHNERMFLFATATLASEDKQDVDATMRQKFGSFTPATSRMFTAQLQELFLAHLDANEETGREIVANAQDRVLRKASDRVARLEAGGVFDRQRKGVVSTPYVLQSAPITEPVADPVNRAPMTGKSRGTRRVLPVGCFLLGHVPPTHLRQA